MDKTSERAACRIDPLLGASLSPPRPEERPPMSGLPDIGSLKSASRLQPTCVAASRRMGRLAMVRDALLRSAPHHEGRFRGDERLDGVQL
jgi:hypothetical protein